MNHRKTTVHLGRKSGPRAALMKQLATSIVLHERVRTTQAKARAVRAFVERCITIGKRQDLASRRLLLSRLDTSGAVSKVLEVLSPRYAQRAGGYLRTTKVGKRQGDAADMVEISFV